MMHHNAGLTLVEMIVALAIIGLIAGVSGLALGGLRPPRESGVIRELRRARAEAIRTGRRVRAESGDSTLTTVLFLPDGRAIGPGVDPLTGVPRDTAR